MEERKGFGSNFGFLMAAVGSAVGLGNIWGFPYKMGANGGFTFLMVYIFLGVTTGFVVMISELAIGRKTGKGAVEAYKMVSKKFKWMGWMGIASAFFILFFYCALGGYCIKYVVLNVGDLLKTGFGANVFAETAAANGTSIGAEAWSALIANPTEAVIYGLIFVALTMLIVLGGVGGGIEKVCSVGMPALFVALLICIIRACTLEGAVDGLKYMFIPGWAVANGVIEKAPNIFQVFATAGGQMFFSLSLGMGAMITYGSYLDKKENIQKNGLLIVIMDSIVAFMAALCVLPGRFALDPNGCSSPCRMCSAVWAVWVRSSAFCSTCWWYLPPSPPPFLCWRSSWRTSSTRRVTRARVTSVSPTPLLPPPPSAWAASWSARTRWVTATSRPRICLELQNRKHGPPIGWTFGMPSLRAS